MRNITAPFKKQTLLLNDHVMNHLVKKKFRIEKKGYRQTISEETNLQRDGTEWGGCRDERNQTKSFEIDYIRHG